MTGKGNSQNQQILRHLQAGGSLTPLEALHRFDCMRLGARIHDLRELGHEIHSDTVRLSNGKCVARYSLQV